MRALLLTPSLPYPPHQGGAIRNFNIIRGLHEAGHEVTLLSFADPDINLASTPLPELCQQVETVESPQRELKHRLRDMFLSRQPDLARRLYSENFRERLKNILRQTGFDLIQFEGLEMATYLSTAQRHQPKARLCYDAHNAEFALQRAIFAVDRQNPRRWPVAAYSWIQSNRIARFERYICQHVDLVVSVSQDDADLLCQIAPQSRIKVIPNGIRASEYEGHKEHIDLGKNVLLFTGKMDYRPNVDAMLWFSSAVLPQIRQQIPDARLHIVGQKPHPQLETLRVQEGIEITGWVPEIQPFLQAADVYVAPLRMGSGTRFKILEALASGLAVVATSAAAAGLHQEAQRVMQIVDNETAMAKAIVSLLQDEQQRRKLGEAAKSYVKEHYDWSVLIPHLLTAYKDIGLG
jgi:polysaccharide biosynthesis protein PslH